MQKGEALHAYQPILELHHIDKRLAFPVGTAIEQAVSTLHIIPLHRSKHLTHFASGTPVRDCEKAQGSQSSQCSLSLLPSFIQSVCSILAISSLKHIARVRASSSLLRQTRLPRVFKATCCWRTSFLNSAAPRSLHVARVCLALPHSRQDFCWFGGMSPHSSLQMYLLIYLFIYLSIYIYIS